MGREIRLIRALADEGYQYTLNDGVPPIPRDRMVTLHLAAEAPRPAVHGRDRGGRRPGRHAPRRRPDEPRRRARLRPARAGDGRGARHRAPRGGARRATSVEAEAWREAFIAEHGVIRAAQPAVRALLQRTTAGVGPGRRRGRRRDRRRPRRPARASGRTTPRRSPTTWRARSPSCGSSATTTGGRTGRCSTSAAARSSCRSSRSTRTRGAVAGPGSPARRAPELAERLYLRFADALRAPRRDRRDRPVRGGDGGRARQRRPVHDLAGHRRWQSLTHFVASAAAAGRRRTADSRSSRNRGRG